MARKPPRSIRPVELGASRPAPAIPPALLERVAAGGPPGPVLAPAPYAAPDTDRPAEPELEAPAAISRALTVDELETPREIPDAKPERYASGAKKRGKRGEYKRAKDRRTVCELRAWIAKDLQRWFQVESAKRDRVLSELVEEALQEWRAKQQGK
jgi:hypothetical protein